MGNELMLSLVQDLLKEVKTDIEKFKQIKPDKWTLKAFIATSPELLTLAKGLVVSVEKVATHVKGISGKDKKDAVMAILQALVDSKIISIPYVPDWLFKKAISLGIDWTIDYYNEKYGKGAGSDPAKNWIEEPNFAVLSIR